MRKFLINLAFTLFIAFGLFVVIAPIVFDARSLERKHRDMVNASVSIYDNDGFGSGVFISDNVILTAGHCLMGEKINIELSDGTVLESSDFYVDDEEDIGFIFVEADEPHIAKVLSVDGDLGDTVFLVGTPHDRELKFSIFKGIISHLNRDIFHWDDLIQTDVQGGLGSSGGPLYNEDGNVIGVCVASPPSSGGGITLCEPGKDILEAYERYIDARKKQINSEG